MINNLQLHFTDKELFPWGGTALLFKLPEKCDMKEALAECPLPPTGFKPWLHSPAQLIYGLLAGICVL